MRKPAHLFVVAVLLLAACGGARVIRNLPAAQEQDVTWKGLCLDLDAIDPVSTRIDRIAITKTP